MIGINEFIPDNKRTRYSGQEKQCDCDVSDERYIHELDRGGKKKEE